MSDLPLYYAIRMLLPSFVDGLDDAPDLDIYMDRFTRQIIHFYNEENNSE